MSPGVIQGAQALGQGGRGNTEQWDIPGVASEALLVALGTSSIKEMKSVGITGGSEGWGKGGGFILFMHVSLRFVMYTTSPSCDLPVVAMPSFGDLRVEK